MKFVFIISFFSSFETWKITHLSDFIRNLSVYYELSAPSIDNRFFCVLQIDCFSVYCAMEIVFPSTSSHF